MTRFREPLFILILLLLPILVFVSNQKSRQDHNVVDRIVVWLSWPVQWLTVASLDGISHTWKQYVYLVGVKQENQTLRDENARLQREVARREEFRLENMRLRALMGLEGMIPFERTIAARVIAVSPTPLFRSLRINRGTQNGVHVGSVVVGPQGVVGRVAAVTFGTSDVIMLVDANHSMDVLVQRTRVRARVRGAGTDTRLELDLEDLARGEDVQPGDLLISSGIGQVFPKGLRVGIVASVTRKKFGLYQKARAIPSVDFRRLEEVLVLKTDVAETLQPHDQPKNQPHVPSANSPVLKDTMLLPSESVNPSAVQP